MSTLIAKISNEENVNKIKKLLEITHDGLNVLENDINNNDTVLIYFGGDQKQVSWVTGFAAVVKTMVNINIYFMACGICIMIVTIKVFVFNIGGDGVGSIKYSVYNTSAYGTIGCS